MKRFFGMALVCAAAVLGTAPAVHAYPPGAPTVAVAGTPVTGGSVTVTVTNCTPGELVTFNLAGSSSVTGTCTAGFTASGVITNLVQGTQPGTAVLPVTGATLNYTVVVAARTGLPATGSSSTFPTAAIALATVLLGGGLFTVARIRRRSSTAA